MKEKIYFGIGCFGVLGVFVMLSEDIYGSIFYLIVSVVFFYLSRGVLKDILNKKNKIIKNSSEKINIKSLIDPQMLPSLERDAKLRREAKRNLVQITSHGESCDLCKKWEKTILNDDVFTNLKTNKNYGLLSDAIKQGLFHTGCKHGLATYYPELEGISYDTPENNILMVDDTTGEVIGRIKK